MTGHESVARISCLRLLTVLGVLLGAPMNSSAQTAAEHAAQAFGHPIVDGQDIQPTPLVVERRLHHYRLMLKAEKNEAAGATAKPAPGGIVRPAKTPNGSRPSQKGVDRRNTEQLCHFLLHGGKRPVNAASNPQRCQ